MPLEHRTGPAPIGAGGDGQPAGTPRIVMLGRPGSGKGTQSERLAERLGVAHISTGALLRDVVLRGTTLDRSVQGLMNRGGLVPDRLLFEMLAERLTREDVRMHGFALDGFPRTVAQAEHLASLTAPQSIDIAINLAIDPRVAIARLLRRRVCAACGQTGSSHSASRPVTTRCPGCGSSLAHRDDDNRPAIVQRLALYEQHTRPLLAWYAAQGLLVIVDAHGSADAVARRVEGACSIWRPARQEAGDNPTTAQAAADQSGLP